MTDKLQRTKAFKIANQRNLASLANDTKWTEFFTAAQQQALSLQIKWLYENQPSSPTIIWLPSGNYVEGHGTGPELFIFIEWISSQNVEAVLALAKQIGLEYQVRGDQVWIYGYR